MLKLLYYKKFSPVKNFLFLFLVLIISYFSVWLFEKRPGLAVLPIILASTLALIYIRSWKLFLVYLFFALLGTGMEILLIAKGYWSYRSNSFLAVPLYLPFIWGNISILSVAIFRGFMIIFGHRFRHSPPHFLPAFIMTLSGIPVFALSVMVFSGAPLRLFFILIGMDILYLLYMRSSLLALAGIVSLAGGTLGDLISVWLGIWNYSATAKIAGVPLYIFAMWYLVGILTAGLYLVLDISDAPLPHWMKKDKIAD